MISLSWQRALRIKRFFIFLLLAISIAGFFPQQTFAAQASLVMKPGTKSVAVGALFTVPVYMSTSAPIDTVRLRGNFAAVGLSLEGMSPGVKLPSVSPGTGIDNVGGTFSFGAFTLQTQVSGTSVLVSTLTFKAKKAGTYDINLLSDSLILSDGVNLFNETGSTLQIVVGGVTSVDVETGTETEVTTGGGGRDTYTIEKENVVINLSSGTHPSSEVWYTSRQVSFSWESSGPVRYFFVSFDEMPEGDPRLSTFGRAFDKNVRSAQFTAPKDGIFYFHFAFETETGEASSILHFPVKIDSTPPVNLALDPDASQFLAGETVAISFGATDDMSGMRDFAVSINGGEYLPAKSPYHFEKLSPGETLFAVRASDQAGNNSYASIRLRAYDPNGPFAGLFSIGKTLVAEPKNILRFTLIIGLGLAVFCVILFLFARASRKRNKTWTN